MITETEKMEKGLLYDPADKSIMFKQALTWRYLKAYNKTSPMNTPRLSRILKKCMGAIGENCYIMPPFYANWAGKHIYIGNNFYANFNFTVVDDGNVFIGNSVMVGPNVTLATAGHPILPELRAKNLQYNADIRIGDNVWLGAGAIILPGVTIGDNAVIGAGSVVTKDIPSGVVAVGSPCRVLREVGERDKEFYFKDKRINLEEI